MIVLSSSNIKDYKDTHAFLSLITKDFNDEVLFNGCTLRDLFKLVETDLDSAELHFQCSISPFLREATGLSLVESSNNESIEGIGLTKHFDILPTDDECGHLEESVACFGYSNGLSNIYHLDGLPLNLIRDLPITTHNYAFIKDYRDPNAVKDVAKIHINFKVKETLKAIFREICFHGTPNERDRYVASFSR